MQEDALQQLFPGLTEEERRLARETLDRYLEIAWEIMESAVDES